MLVSIMLMSRSGVEVCGWWWWGTLPAARNQRISSRHLLQLYSSVCTYHELLFFYITIGLVQPHGDTLAVVCCDVADVYFVISMYARL